VEEKRNQTMKTVYLNKSKEWRVQIRQRGIVVGQVKSVFNRDIWRDSTLWRFSPGQVQGIVKLKRGHPFWLRNFNRLLDGSYKIGCQEVSRATVLKVYKLSRAAEKAWKKKIAQKKGGKR
jgi:hypothetical protein